MMLEAFRERNFSDPAKIRVVATRYTPVIPTK
jgi:hypothetical protein